jgi:type IV pilus assembly protein PilM
MTLKNLIKDPPPEFVFELSEAGIAHMHGERAAFGELPPGALKASPLEDNLLEADAAAAVISQLAPPHGAKAHSEGVVRAGKKKRRRAAILLPDAAARVAVLDFDVFPDSPAEQLPLVRFRVKRTIPFDIDAAAVGYYRQPGTNQKGKIEVVAVTVALEVLARYEALFRNAGFHPGDVAVSALAALELYRGEEPAVLARLAGSHLTVMLAAGGKLKLFRCLALEEASEEEILSVLRPTFAYAEDELESPVQRLILCGVENVRGLPCEAEPLESRLGMPTAFNAGLYGYVEACA